MLLRLHPRQKVEAMSAILNKFNLNNRTKYCKKWESDSINVGNFVYR
jgi:hypothetical protein